jgi:hypothetical protein
MRIELALLAEAVDIHAGKLYVLGGGFNVLRAEHFPADFSPISLVATITFAPAELDQVADPGTGEPTINVGLTLRDRTGVPVPWGQLPQAPMAGQLITVDAQTPVACVVVMLLPSFPLVLSLWHPAVWRSRRVAEQDSFTGGAPSPVARARSLRRVPGQRTASGSIRAASPGFMGRQWPG